MALLFHSGCWGVPAELALSWSCCPTLGPISRGQDGAGAGVCLILCSQFPRTEFPSREGTEGSQRSRERGFWCQPRHKHSQAAAIHPLTLGTPGLENFPDTAELLRTGCLWLILQRFSRAQKLLGTQQIQPNPTKKSNTKLRGRAWRAEVVPR